MLPEAVAEHYRSQQRLTVATLALTRQAWARMGEDFDASWGTVGPLMSLVTARAQLAAATSGAGYVAATLDELGIQTDPAGEVNPRAFVGVASDGRPLDTLLEGAKVRAKDAVASGAPVAEALTAGGQWLDMVVHTQVADAARGAAGAGIAVRPRVGYARMLNPPSCSRCAILAGKFYRWNEGFLRHPRCDCRHVPANEDVAGDLRTDPKAYFESLSPAEQDRVFTKAGAEAVRYGADINQVVNARRGARGLTAPGRLTLDEQKMLRGGRSRGRLERVDVYGRPVFVTSEGVTTRGVAGQRLREESGTVATGSYQRTQRLRNGKTTTQTVRIRSARTPRLMPESILEIAEDREDAIRLLRRFGYIT